MVLFLENVRGMYVMCVDLLRLFLLFLRVL